MLAERRGDVGTLDGANLLASLIEELKEQLAAEVASAVVCGAGAFAGGQAHRNVTGFERSAVIVPPPRTFDCGSTESNGGSI